MIYDNILQATGNTPLIKLNKIVPKGYADIFVKYEGMNVGGSIKTRVAYGMIKDAIDNGLITKDSIITEATSGNQGIGLALAGAVLDIKVRIVMPDSVSIERRKLISQYGAELVLVHDEGNIGKAIDDCLNLVRKMQEEDKNVFVPKQFSNPANPIVHENETAREILADIGRKIDGFTSGIGTGGTLSGIGRALKNANPDTFVLVAEPENAAILSGGKIGSHIQMGIGDGIIPDNLDKEIYDGIIKISDEDAINHSKLLAKKEGILCGISSGTNLAAAMTLAKRLGKGKTVVTVLPDTGERYISTELFD